MDSSQFSWRNEDSPTKSDSLALNLIKEMLRERIFLMCGNNDKFDLIEVFEPFLLSQDLEFEFMEKLIGRVILNSQKGVRNIHEDDWLYFVNDVVIEQA